MTVKQLKEKLKGVPDNTPVYLADHDHADYETNCLAYSVHIQNQKDAGADWHNNKFNDAFKIKGTYLVIHG